MENIMHQAERKAFEKILRNIVDKAQYEDVSELAESIVSLMKKILGSSWKDESYQLFIDGLNYLSREKEEDNAFSR